MKVAMNAYDLDIDRLASSTKNNTFLDIADYTSFYLGKNMTDLSQISHIPISSHKLCMIVGLYFFNLTM